LILRGVIFDLDGVIIDSHPIHRSAWRRFLASVGKNVTEEQLNFVLDGRKREEILQHFLGELSADELREYGRRKEELFREEAMDLQPTGGLNSFLEELRAAGLLLSVASSGSKSRVGYVLDRLHLTRLFQAVITGDDVLVGKPNPEIFQLAASAMGCGPSEVVVIEDAVAGVVAAKAAGMKCLAMATNGRRAALLKAGADHVASNFHEVSVATLAKLGNGHFPNC
jgi:HAD superfamily hydrolase (TIGR01509 family)